MWINSYKIPKGETKPVYDEKNSEWSTWGFSGVLGCLGRDEWTFCPDNGCGLNSVSIMQNKICVYQFQFISLLPKRCNE